MTPLSPSPGPPMTRSVVPGKAGLGIGLMVPDHWAVKVIRLLAGFGPPDSDSLLFPSGYWCSGVSAARMGPDERQTARMADRVAAVTWRMRVVPPVWNSVPEIGESGQSSWAVTPPEGLILTISGPERTVRIRPIGT